MGDQSWTHKLHHSSIADQNENVTDEEVKKKKNESVRNAIGIGGELFSRQSIFTNNGRVTIFSAGNTWCEIEIINLNIKCMSQPNLNKYSTLWTVCYHQLHWVLSDDTKLCTRQYICTVTSQSHIPRPRSDHHPPPSGPPWGGTVPQDIAQRYTMLGYI